jgi:hypothetical protein
MAKYRILSLDGGGIRGILTAIIIDQVSMSIHDGDNKSVKKCTECNGCINCTVEYCIFNSYGNAETCYRDICTYCDRFLQKQRLFLNNVG